MRHLLTLTLLFSACSWGAALEPPISFADKPPEETVRMLEARLAREPCIGSLDRWSRRYSYWAPKGRLDLQAVVIKLAEAGHDGRPSGISIEPVRGVFEFDDRMFRSAFGIYDARRNVIRFWRCGSNIGSAGPPRGQLKM